MRIKDINIKEDATPGATTSGNIAILAGPALKNSRGIAYTGSPSTGSGKKAPTPWMPKNQKPTDNALDGDILLADKQPNIIRRQIKEGSLYEYGSKSVEHCVKIAQALGDDDSHCYPTKPKEEKKSPWWKFWDDANIPRTEREAIGIIQEAFKMRNEGIKLRDIPQPSEDELKAIKYKKDKDAFYAGQLANPTKYDYDPKFKRSGKSRMGKLSSDPIKDLKAQLKGAERGKTDWLRNKERTRQGAWVKPEKTHDMMPKHAGIQMSPKAPSKPKVKMIVPDEKPTSR